jgi:hypothetical protein
VDPPPIDAGDCGDRNSNEAVQARGLDMADIRREDFPLPTLGPVLDRLRAEVLDGRGFALLRGMTAPPPSPKRRGRPRTATS